MKKTVMLLPVLLTAAAAAGCGDEANFVQHGKASFYGDSFEGKPTAGGEPYRADRMTAAHKHLPLGTKATVVHDGTGERIEVTINDRGPYVDGRIIDLSDQARQALGFDKRKGVIEVTLRAELKPKRARDLRARLSDAE